MSFRAAAHLKICFAPSWLDSLRSSPKSHQLEWPAIVFAATAMRIDPSNTLRNAE
jgi:hypothetical protein